MSHLEHANALPLEHSDQEVTLLIVDICFSGGSAPMMFIPVIWMPEVAPLCQESLAPNIQIFKPNLPALELPCGGP